MIEWWWLLIDAVIFFYVGVFAMCLLQASREIKLEEGNDMQTELFDQRYEYQYKCQAIKNPFKEGSQAHKILERLKVRPYTNYEFVASPRDGGLGQYNFRSRLADLKRKGIPYQSRHIKDDLWEYRLEVL